LNKEGEQYACNAAGVVDKAISRFS